MTSRRLLMVALWLVCSPAVALAQSDRFELGAQLISANLSPFDQADFGFGARFSWNPVRLAGLESEINFYPKDLPGEVPFSRRRIEGLFGATFGPRFGSLRPFAKARAGFLSFHEDAFFGHDLRFAAGAGLRF